MTILFILGCLASFILGAIISAKISKNISEDNHSYNHTPKCFHSYKYKEVGDVDGFVWRNVCEKCGDTKI